MLTEGAKTHPGVYVIRSVLPFFLMPFQMDQPGRVFCVLTYVTVRFLGKVYWVARRGEREPANSLASWLVNR